METASIHVVCSLHALALMLQCCIAFRNATSRYTRQRPNGLKNVTLGNGYPPNSTSLSANLVDLTTFCPIGRTAKEVHRIPPYGNKLNEVSYMVHSNQLYKGKAAVVW